MRTLQSAFIVFALVLAVLSFALPTEDVPETAYDESESLPYESSGVFSLVVHETVAEPSVDPPHVSVLRGACLTRLCTKCLSQRTGSAYPICDSLTILDHSLRC
jgi:hypothetical protein